MDCLLYTSETVLAICREWADQSGVYCFCGSERTTFPQVAACYQVPVSYTHLSVYDEVKRLLKEARCYFLNDEEAAKVADVFFNAKTLSYDSGKEFR